MLLEASKLKVLFKWSLCWRRFRVFRYVWKPKSDIVFQLAPARLTLKLRACTLRSTVLCIVLRARIIYTTRSVVYIVRRESLH